MALHRFEHQELPWAMIFQKRCRARLELRNESNHRGKCELTPHDDDMDHALERGLSVVRWSTKLTGV